MNWIKHAGGILKSGGGIAVDPSCCCDVVDCCVNCPALDSYLLDLKIVASGALTFSATPPIILARFTTLGDCDSWRSANLQFNELCMDNTEFHVICKGDGNVKVKWTGPPPDCTVSGFDEELTPDTLECGDSGDDDVLIIKSYTLTGCACAGTVTFTITK